MTNKTVTICAVIASAMVLNGCDMREHWNQRQSTGATEETLYPDPRDRSSFRLRVLHKKLMEYGDTSGVYPETIAEAVRDLPQMGQDEIRRDAWQVPIAYSRHGTGFELRSAGPDMRLGTKDDLVMTGRSGNR